MIQSMTGFASQQGGQGDVSWTWDIRGVNGKGLDIRTRLPDGIDGLDAGTRKAVGAVATRGNITVSLKLAREDSQLDTAVDPDRLLHVIATLRDISKTAADAGFALAPSRAVDLYNIRGVTRVAETETEDLLQPLLTDLSTALAAFSRMRATEGAALHDLLSANLDAIAARIAEARAAAGLRPAAVAKSMQAAIERVTGASDAVSEERLAQELALIAVKSDVTEELDRLDTHVAAARSHLTAGSPVGRKLDFLAQEFNREANTLCAKSQDTDLTAAGLALKALIDQLREQSQNVE